MMGVASRNEKRVGVLVVEAAEQAGHHGGARPADAGEQGGDLRAADDHALAVLERVERAVRVALGGAAPHLLAAEEDQAVDGEEDGGGHRLREHDTQLVLEDQPHDADRDRAEHEEPRHALVSRLDLAPGQRAEEAGG